MSSQVKSITQMFSLLSSCSSLQPDTATMGFALAEEARVVSDLSAHDNFGEMS